MKGNCIVCNKEIEITMCGMESGCIEQPTEPPVCSNECYDELINNIEKYYPSDNRIVETFDINNFMK